VPPLTSGGRREMHLSKGAVEGFEGQQTLSFPVGRDNANGQIVRLKHKLYTWAELVEGRVGVGSLFFLRTRKSRFILRD
jgi:hypothetical protein